MEAQIPISSLNTPVSIYRSKKNGTTLYHVEKDGPIVNGYIVYNPNFI